jgi:hypothetical protein
VSFLDGTDHVETVDVTHPNAATPGGHLYASNMVSADGNTILSDVGRSSSVTHINHLTAVEHQAVALTLPQPAEADSDTSTTATITGVPDAVTFNHGTHHDDGSWTLSQADLAGLTLTAAMVTSASFTLHVSETTIDGTGVTASTASASADILVDTTLQAGVPALFLQGTEGHAIGLPIVSEMTTRGEIDYTSSFSLTIDGIPQDAVLTNSNNDTLTPDQNGSISFTNAQVAAGALNGLAITPTEADGNVVLHTTAVVADPLGGSSSTTFHEDIKLTTSDVFVLATGDLSAAQGTPPVLADILDYSNAKGDKIDLEALLDQAFGSGQKATDLVQVTHDANGTSSTLAVDVQGTNTPNQFVSLAHLDNVHAGDVVTAILDHAQHTAQVHVG